MHAVLTNGQFTVAEYSGHDGTTLRYGKLVNPEAATYPKNRALLFVPGLGGSVKGALAFLNGLLPDYDVIYGPDLRGFGLNPIESPLFSTQPILDDLKAFHQHLNLQPNQHLDLCGISLGGIIAITLATQQIAHYQKLVLLAPAYEAHPARFTPSYILKNIVNRIIYGKKHHTHLPYGLEALTQNEAILSDPQFSDSSKTPLSIDFLLSVRALGLNAMRATRQLQLPTLMVIPGKDIVCEPAAMRRGFQQIPASTPKQCLDYPDLFHDILFEKEIHDIAEETRKWLKS